MMPALRSGSQWCDSTSITFCRKIATCAANRSQIHRPTSVLKEGVEMLKMRTQTPGVTVAQLNEWRGLMDRQQATIVEQRSELAKAKKDTADLMVAIDAY